MIASSHAGRDDWVGCEEGEEASRGCVWIPAVFGGDDSASYDTANWPASGDIEDSDGVRHLHSVQLLQQDTR